MIEWNPLTLTTEQRGTDAMKERVTCPHCNEMLTEIVISGTAIYYHGNVRYGLSIVCPGAGEVQP